MQFTKLGSGMRLRNEGLQIATAIEPFRHDPDALFSGELLVSPSRPFLVITTTRLPPLDRRCCHR